MKIASKTDEENKGKKERKKERTYWGRNLKIVRRNDGENKGMMKIVCKNNREDKRKKERKKPGLILVNGQTEAETNRFLHNFYILYPKKRNRIIISANWVGIVLRYDWYYLDI